MEGRRGGKGARSGFGVNDRGAAGTFLFFFIFGFGMFGGGWCVASGYLRHDGANEGSIPRAKTRSRAKSVHRATRSTVPGLGHAGAAGGGVGGEVARQRASNSKGADTRTSQQARRLVRTRS